MHAIFFKKKKKGFITLQEAIILFFGALILVGMIWFMVKLYSLFISDPDDGSIANFRRLHKEVIKLLEDQDSYPQTKQLNYFTSKDYVVVGFDTEWDAFKGKEKHYRNLIFGELGIVKDQLFKPLRCGNSACLCLYKKGDLPSEPQDSERKLVECKLEGLADKTIIFGSSFNPAATFNYISQEDIVNALYVTGGRLDPASYKDDVFILEIAVHNWVSGDYGVFIGPWGSDFVDSGGGTIV